MLTLKLTRAPLPKFHSTSRNSQQLLFDILHKEPECQHQLASQ